MPLPAYCFKIHRFLGLIAKTYAPGVPLSLLCLAGAIPDATFFVLNFLGIEAFAVNDEYSKRGCFPYATYYVSSRSPCNDRGLFRGIALIQFSAIQPLPTRHDIDGQVMHGCCISSLTENISKGMGLAAAYKAISKRHDVPLQDLAVIVAASASHFLLELPAHREGTHLYSCSISGWLIKVAQMLKLYQTTT